MKHQFLYSILTAALLTIAAPVAVAQERLPPSSGPDQEAIYGSELMTEKERVDHRAKMRAAKNDQEREKIRLDHHKVIQAHAKERGMIMPDEPPPRSSGQGKAPGGY